MKTEFDVDLVKIADYLDTYSPHNKTALMTAYHCLLDSLGCAFLALRYPDCTKLLGPLLPGMSMTQGARVPGTSFELDPVRAAFNIGSLIRWLDFNDTWLAAEWGHPSDNLGAILAIADYLNRQSDEKPLLIKDVLEAMIQAYEIQGILALENSFNHVGMDHVVLVKLASAALSVKLLDGSREVLLNALSQVWVDGQSLRTYRHAPNTGSRKSWAAGDASSRGLYLALLSMKGEMGYPSALTARGWGFFDVSFQGKSFKYQREYNEYVMENILFKLSFPAEFHAQTAVECAMALYPDVRDRWDEIIKIELATQESAVRIIDKQGPLHNPADRDHCLQYMVAIGLIYGELTADHYDDNIAADPRIDKLRDKMIVKEDPIFTRDYLDPTKRSIANAVQVHFKDGSSTQKITVEYPIGHRKRREEGIPLLLEKFEKSVRGHFSADQADKIITTSLDSEEFFKLPVHKFFDLLVI